MGITKTSIVYILTYIYICLLSLVIYPDSGTSDISELSIYREGSPFIGFGVEDNVSMTGSSYGVFTRGGSNGDGSSEGESSRFVYRRAVGSCAG